MKRALLLLMCLFALVIGAMAQGVGAVVEPVSFIKENWIELLFGLLALVEIVVRLTPTKKDDSILAWIMKLITALFPNRKKNGGKHLM